MTKITRINENKPLKKRMGKTRRCEECRKRIALAGVFVCECNKTLCMKHRFTWKHNCNSIDHNKKYKNELRKRLVKLDHGHRMVKL